MTATQSRRSGCATWSFIRWPVFAALLVLLAACAALAQAAQVLHGRVFDPDGHAVPGASVTCEATITGEHAAVQTRGDGSFQLALPVKGPFRLTIRARGFAPVTLSPASVSGELEVHLASLAPATEAITVSASLNSTSLSEPDPAQQVLVHQDLLDANPGRPGAPVSIPGVPVETASGGIKAPQYFVPGVAGDHGEPIAQYLMLGDFLIPNNLSANAHGNGYADPNILIPAVLAGVRTDAGAFNVLEGNHALNFAAAFQPRPWLDRSLIVTGDGRDLDLVASFSPRSPQNSAWLALEGSYGNGLLRRLEHRQQEKINGLKTWQSASNTFRLLGIGYYGQSYVPGLVPLALQHSLDDTVDRRQHDQTHTGELAASDQWALTPTQQLSLSAMGRTYNLALLSNFGDGLIRQSEFRTVLASNAAYTSHLNQHLNLLAGLDEDRDAPRRLELDHSLSSDPLVEGPFLKITENNLTLNDAAPLAAVDGSVLRFLHYYLGWRRDEVQVTNEDLVTPANSFQHLDGVNNPKATLTFAPPSRLLLPLVSFSFGEAFFTNDPRIGTGAARPSSVERSHSAQLVLEEAVGQTDLRLVLNRTTTDQTLAKLDADTGLQEDQGPGKLYSLTAMARHTFRFGLLEATLSKADARDLNSGEPTPEAPRTIIDVLGSFNHLPWDLEARTELEYVGHKPLGDGFEAVPVTELRGALVKRLDTLPLELGFNFLLARGATGQTTEDLPAGWTPASGPPGCPATNLDCASVETAVGVRLPSFVGGSVSWRFGERRTF